MLTFHNLKNLNKSQYIIIKNNGKYRTENKKTLKNLK